MLGALSLAYVSNLFGSMTHYGSGQVWPAPAQRCYLQISPPNPSASLSVGTVWSTTLFTAWLMCMHVWWHCQRAPALITALEFPARMLLQGDVGYRAYVGTGLIVQAAVYYGAGYLDLKEVFSIGGIMVVVNALLWGVAGSIWWKICGFY